MMLIFVFIILLYIISLGNLCIRRLQHGNLVRVLSLTLAPLATSAALSNHYQLRDH